MSVFYYDESWRKPDPPLTPSLGGWKCLGNGEDERFECCCDECSFYLICFPGDPEED